MSNSSLGLHPLKIAVIIPALNEAKTIQSVISGVNPYAHAIVIDDGSSDDTSLQADAAGALLLRHSKNLGYDKALESGLRLSVELDFDAAITIDADGQHDPLILIEYINAFQEGYDLVLGERDKLQRWSEALFSIVGFRVWGIKDPLCGMKGYKISLLKEAGTLNRYGLIGTEVALRASKSDVNFKQILVPTKPRVGKSRFGDGFRANLRILRALIVAIICLKKFNRYT